MTTLKSTENSKVILKPSQLDMNRLADWAVQWQLRFNPTKCESLRITRNRDKSVPCYTMGSEIKSVKSAQDLGVIICSDLSWNDHDTATANKANKMLGLIYRTIGSSNKRNFYYPIQNPRAPYP